MTVEAMMKPREIGDELRGRDWVMTVERVRWYGDGLLTTATGQVTQVGSNIHTDPEYARSQGLPTVIADGMISTNWIQSMLLDQYGNAFLESGMLRTRYVRPTVVGAHIRVLGRVRERVAEGAGTRLVIDVWAEDVDGMMLTVGEASVVID